MIRKAILFVGLLSAQYFTVFAQTSEVDHLKRSINQITDSLKYVDALNRLSTLMYERNLDSSFILTRQARSIAERHDYVRGKADAFTNLGTFFYYKGNLEMGLRYYNNALTLYNNIQDSSNVVQSMMNIANVYGNWGKNKRSQEWYERAIKAGNSLRNDSIMALVIYDYMFNYPDKFTGRKKEINVDKIKEIAVRYKDERMLLLGDIFVANELFKKGKRKEAIELLSKVAIHAVDSHYLFSLVHIYDKMGDMLSPDNPTKAAEMYNKALAITEKDVNLSYSIHLSGKLVDLYTQVGNSKQLTFYLRKQADLYQRQIQLQNSSEIDYLDYALKEEQVKSLDQRSRYQIILLVTISIGCLLAIAFLLVIRQNLGRTKKFNEQISEQNEKLIRAFEALQQSQADNTHMLKVVAHDLRGPIAGIFSLTQLMLEEDGISESNKEMLQLIKSSSEDCLKLSNSILQVHFKTETLEKGPVELAGLLQRCVSLLRSSADAKMQTIKLHLQPTTLMASSEKLFRVINNLVTNAIKFSPDKSIIELEIEKGAGYVRIKVADEGMGIPLEIEDNIFEMFTKGRRLGTAGEKTFGLGLAISKQIVEAHGGKIWFERKVDSGTLFIVELPLN